MGSRIFNTHAILRTASADRDSTNRRKKRSLQQISITASKRATSSRNRKSEPICTLAERGGSEQHSDRESASSDDEVVRRDERAKFQSEDVEGEVDGSESEISFEKDQARKSERSCRCGRTKCLKQYCACFRTDTRCTSDCVCLDCKNDGLHEQERMTAVRHVIMNSSSAFKGTCLAPGQEVASPGGTVKFLRGCRCKKSRCQKKYCECFGAGQSCTMSCICIDCINGGEGSLDSILNASQKPTARAETKGTASGRQRPQIPAVQQGTRSRPRLARPVTPQSEHSPDGSESEFSDNKSAVEEVQDDDMKQETSESDDSADEDSDNESHKQIESCDEGSPLAPDDDGDDDATFESDAADGEEPGTPCSRTPSTCAGNEDQDLPEQDVFWTPAAIPRWWEGGGTAWPCSGIGGGGCGGGGLGPVVPGYLLDKAGLGPAQCRTGWDTDEIATSLCRAVGCDPVDASLCSTAPQWSGGVGGLATSVTSADADGSALLQCMACPCSPVGEDGLPWELHIGNVE